MPAMDTHSNYDPITDGPLPEPRLPLNDTDFKLCTRRLHDLRQKVDSLWKTYLETGIKFYLNVPFTIYKSDFDYAFQEPGQHDFREVREAFDSNEVTLWLQNFNQLRRLTQAAEKYLADRLDPTTELVTLDEDADTFSDEWIPDIVNSYESVVAATNALASSGKIPGQDPWAKDRAEVFELWSGLLKQFSEMPIEDVDRWADTL